MLQHDCAQQAARVHGHEGIVDKLVQPDPDDRHVLAAAILCGGEVIVTFNLSDLQGVALSPYRVDTLHPDDLFAELIASDAVKFVGAQRGLRAALQNPAYTPIEMIGALRRTGLPRSASALTAMAELLGNSPVSGSASDWPDRRELSAMRDYGVRWL